MKGSVLELGGKDPQIVCADADLANAISGCVWGGFANAGQTCSGIERTYVVERGRRRVPRRASSRETERLTVGDPLEWETEIGPMVSAEQADIVTELVDDALAARRRAAHRRPDARSTGSTGSFIAPTVLAGVERRDADHEGGDLRPGGADRSSSTARRRRSSAPTTPKFGLGASVWTKDRAKGERMARRIESGMVWINDHSYSHGACQCSWGGVKDSGLGRSHSKFGFYECVEHQARRLGARPAPATSGGSPTTETLGTGDPLVGAAALRPQRHPAAGAARGARAAGEGRRTDAAKGEVMKARTALAAAAALLAVAVFPATASAAHSETQTVGSVTATVSWKHNFARTKNFKLTIDRAGVRVFDAKVEANICKPRKVKYPCVWPAGQEPLDLLDLDEDGEPEAVVGAFTGGAHCCVIAIVYRWNGSAYERAEHNFLDAGYSLEDLDQNGRSEFVSRDARFAYLYGSFAESVFPIQIYGFNNAFIDVTTGFPEEVGEDASGLRHEYKRRAKTRRKLGVRTALAAYIADLYSLDNDEKAKGVLNKALHRGLLDRQTRFDTGPFGKRFIRHLNRTLDSFGYR